MGADAEASHNGEAGVAPLTFLVQGDQFPYCIHVVDPGQQTHHLRPFLRGKGVLVGTQGVEKFRNRQFAGVNFLLEVRETQQWRLVGKEGRNAVVSG